MKEKKIIDYNLKVEIFCKVLDKIPFDSVFHLEEYLMDDILSHFSEFRDFSDFTLVNEGEKYEYYYYFSLNTQSIPWLKQFVKCHNFLENLTFYRIYNKERTEIFLRVYDTDSYEVSKSLNIEESVIEEWNSRQGQGCYWGMSDHIPYTEELIV